MSKDQRCFGSVVGVLNKSYLSRRKSATLVTATHQLYEII